MVDDKYTFENPNPLDLAQELARRIDEEIPRDQIIHKDISIDFNDINRYSDKLKRFRQESIDADGAMIRGYVV